MIPASKVRYAPYRSSIGPPCQKRDIKKMFLQYHFPLHSSVTIQDYIISLSFKKPCFHAWSLNFATSRCRIIVAIGHILAVRYFYSVENIKTWLSEWLSLKSRVFFGLVNMSCLKNRKVYLEKDSNYDEFISSLLGKLFSIENRGWKLIDRQWWTKYLTGSREER